jgi:hypothetical protein
MGFKKCHKYEELRDFSGCILAEDNGEDLYSGSFIVTR